MRARCLPGRAAWAAGARLHPCAILAHGPCPSALYLIGCSPQSVRAEIAAGVAASRARCAVGRLRACALTQARHARKRLHGLIELRGGQSPERGATTASTTPGAALRAGAWRRRASSTPRACSPGRKRRRCTWRSRRSPRTAGRRCWAACGWTGRAP